MLAYVQGVELYSPDGSTYLVMQNDGNLVLYQALTQNALYYSASYGNSPQPFSALLQPVRGTLMPSPLCSC